jgi:hypothetical protein
LFKPQIECWQFRPPKDSKCEELFLKRKESCDDKFGSLSQFGEISHKRIWLVKGWGGGRAGRAGGDINFGLPEETEQSERESPKSKESKRDKKGARGERTVSTDVRKRKHKAKKMTT